MAGQGTVALELFEQDPAIDTLIVAIGGGGLISGISVAAKALNPRLRIIGVEPVGAPTLHASLAAGRVVELPEVTTAVPTTIFLPENVSPPKLAKLKRWGADIRIVGKVWDESNVAALKFAEETGAAYFHPFADPLIAAGQGTVGLEILDDMPDVDTILVAIGGGGLISGISVAVKALKPNVRIIGIEPVGAPTLHDSLKAGKVVTLEKVTTRVPTMAAARTDEKVFEIVRKNVEQIVLLTDDEMLEAARWLWFELGIAADLSGAASIAALMSGKFKATPDSHVCALICGAGPDGISD
jgi:threonine dehydratase